jgi:predicted LPLAT superfamily acyltransferase
MSRGWLDQQERGSLLAYRVMVWVAFRLGRRVGRALLYPICAYFVVRSQETSRSIQIFLDRALNRRASFQDRFRHYHCFASTLLDRAYLLTQQYHRFTFDIHGAEALLRCLERKQGCILLGSHLGSFEAVRAGALSYREVDLKLLMHADNAAMFNAVVHQLAPSLSQSIITIGSPDSMLRVKECVDQGGVVGILGDRFMKSEKTVTCQFLGKPALFPAGPMLLLSVLKVPVFLFFGLYRGGNRYEVHFELFAEQIEIERQSRERGIQQWTQYYVTRLEYYCRLAPYNWFNFYNYWDETL